MKRSVEWPRPLSISFDVTDWGGELELTSFSVKHLAMSAYLYTPQWQWAIGSRMEGITAAQIHSKIGLCKLQGVLARQTARYKWGRRSGFLPAEFQKLGLIVFQMSDCSSTARHLGTCLPYLVHYFEHAFLSRRDPDFHLPTIPTIP